MRAVYGEELEGVLKETVLRRTRALVTSQLPTRGDSPSCTCTSVYRWVCMTSLCVGVCVYTLQLPTKCVGCHTKTGPSESEG